LAAKRVKIFRNLRVFGEAEFFKQYRRKGETVALVLVRSDCDPSTSSLLASNWLLYRKADRNEKNTRWNLSCWCSGGNGCLSTMILPGQRRQCDTPNRENTDEGKGLSLRLLHQYIHVPIAND
jgi:hypothetical protein